MLLHAWADALVRAGRPCRVLALINDSVGVLTAARYFDQSTGMGLIMGTGTNACIVEKVSCRTGQHMAAAAAAGYFCCCC